MASRLGIVNKTSTALLFLPGTAEIVNSVLTPSMLAEETEITSALIGFYFQF
jgi:hypothetical protein